MGLGSTNLIELRSYGQLFLHVLGAHILRAITQISAFIIAQNRLISHLKYDDVGKYDFMHLYANEFFFENTKNV